MDKVASSRANVSKPLAELRQRMLNYLGMVMFSELVLPLVLSLIIIIIFYWLHPHVHLLIQMSKPQKNLNF